MQRPHLKLKAGEASSQDFNQSIFCTLNRFGKADLFWSSPGYDTPENNEHLSYSIVGEQSAADNQEETKVVETTSNTQGVTVGLGQTA